MTPDELRNELKSHAAFAQLPKIIIEKLIEGLDAMETKTATHQGQITTSQDFIDYSVRLNYIKFVCVLGGFGPKEIDDGPGLSDFTPEQLNEKRLRIEGELRRLGIISPVGLDEGVRGYVRGNTKKRRTK